MTYDSLNKGELIQKQVMEKTSGTEIINRLIKLGLIEQFDDETDKRSMRVKMTVLGRMEIVKILPQMQKQVHYEFCIFQNQQAHTKKRF